MTRTMWAVLAFVMWQGAAGPVRAQDAANGGSARAEEFLTLEQAGRALPRLQAPVRLAAGLTVERALRSIAEQIGFRVLYRGELAGLDASAPAQADSLPAAEALTRLLRGTRLDVRISRSGQMVVITRPVRGSGSLSGVVLAADTRAPLANALVSIDGGRSALTDSAGAFRIAAVLAGPHAVGITALGHVPVRLDSVLVGPGADTRLDTALVVEALPLDAIVVTPGTFDVMQENGAKTQALTRPEIEAMPQLLEDINRAVTRLPGVNAEDASARFSLRGGGYDELLVLLDGVELDEPFHLTEIGGVLSIIDVEAIGGVEVTSGGFTAEYGDRLTGVFDLKTLSLPTLGTHLSAGLSASNARLMGRGGFARDRGQWLLSARRGYFDLVLQMVGEDETGLVPRYGDVLAKVDYRLSDRHQLSANVLGANDQLLMRRTAGSDPDDGDYRATRSSAYVWTNWRASWTPTLSSRTVLSVTRLNQHRGGIDLAYGLQNGYRQIDDQTSYATALRQSWLWGISDRNALKWGFGAKRVSADYDRWVQVDPAFATVSPPPEFRRTLARAGTQLGGYLAYRLRPWDALTAEAGLRYDHYGLTREGLWSPRLNLALSPRDGTTLRLAWGLSYQGQAANQINVVDGDTLLYPADRAEHRVIGLEQRLSPSITGRLEVYERRMGNLRPRFFNATNILAPVLETEPDRIMLDATDARARGLELLLSGRPAAGRVRWSASYTLASVRDRIDGFEIPRLDDHRHALQLEIGYRASENFSINAGWQFHTGNPVYAPAFQLDTASNGTIWAHEYFDMRELERLPAYHRLDLRATRSFPLGAGRMNVFVDVFNAYSRHNPRGWEFTPAFDASGGYTLRRAQYRPTFGILPTFGVSWGF